MASDWTGIGGAVSNLTITYNPAPAPTLTGPPNATVLVDPNLTPTLTSSPCNGCTAYDFQISTDQTFNSAGTDPTDGTKGYYFCDSGTVPGPSWAVPAGCLADGETSYWRVEGVNQGILTIWSSPWSLAVWGPVNWGFEVSPSNPSAAPQDGIAPYYGPTDSGTPAAIGIYVVNQSAATWAAGGNVAVSYHVLNAAGTGTPLATGTATAFTSPVAPGQGTTVEASVTPFQTAGLPAGSYVLAFDLTNQGGFLSAQNGPAVEADFHILVATPPAPSAPASGATITPGIGGSLQPTLTSGTCTGCTGYQFQVSTRTDFGAYVTSSGWLSSPSWTLPSGTLQPGGTYYWRVIGRDQYHASTAWSAVSTFSTPTVPPAPTAVSASAGAAAATVTWTAPSTTGGAAITGYSIVPSLSSRPQPAISVPCQVVNNVSTCTPTMSYTDTALTNGGVYTFTVAAVNGMGAGPASSPPSAPVTPATVPGVPGAVAAIAGSGQATVTWQAAASGGSPVTGYSVTTYIGGSATGTTGAGGTATSAVVGGLTNATAYTFAVAASNADGAGAASGQTAAVTPGASPAVALNLDASQYARGQSATVTATITPAGGSATPTFVQGTAQPNGKTATYPTGVTAGDLLVIGITTNDTGTDQVTKVSDNLNGIVDEGAVRGLWKRARRALVLRRLGGRRDHRDRHGDEQRLHHC